MTTIANSIPENTAVILLDRPYVGLTHPDYPEFIKTLVRLIAKATKRSAKALWIAMKSAAKWLDRKFQEGAEIHNRQTQMLDERYNRNFYHLRSLI